MEALRARRSSAEEAVHVNLSSAIGLRRFLVIKSNDHTGGPRVDKGNSVEPPRRGDYAIIKLEGKATRGFPRTSHSIQRLDELV